jgi:hypothetical protein
MRTHRISDPPDCFQQVLGEILCTSGGETGETQRQVLERDCEGWNATAIRG